jgi:organic radical activating enzyme
MNLQERMAVERSFTGNISMHEVFYSIQGEGPFSGIPAVFVRLGGCNLNCSFCDTQYFITDVLSISQVVEIARKSSAVAKLVVVTGGEPLRQAGVVPLVNALGGVFDTVQIETSGSCYPYYGELRGELGSRLVVVCSPKTVKLHPGILPHVDAYKYILRNGYVSADDGLPVQCPQTLKPVVLARPTENRFGVIPPIYVGPWDMPGETLQNTEAAVMSCLQFGYRLSLQVHKIVHLP